MTSLISGLNPPQKQAVLHNTGPILTLAGAGSGKTRVLTHRIARLVLEKLCKPSQILAVTFTNKAAKEMQERIAHLVGNSAARDMTVSTFHSLGVKILRESGTAIGIQKNFTILDDHQRLLALKDAVRVRGNAKARDEFDLLSTRISLAKNANIHPEKYGDANPDLPYVERVYKTYQKALQKQQALDFDDLLLMPLRLFEQHPDILQKYQKRFEYVSIDEFQDTNVVQMQLAILLSAPKNNIMVVGDDDQGIYSWRGAEIDNIISFPQKFKGCTTIILDRNYRSTSQILDGAHAVVAHNKKRKHKNIIAVAGRGEPIMHYAAEDETDEAEWIAKTIQKNVQLHQYNFKSHALLFRANATMRRFEEALRREHVPYKVVGAASFFDRKEIRDVMAYLRFFANPNDELSLTRVLKVPNKGITPTSIEKLAEFAVRRNLPLFDAFTRHETVEGILPKQHEALDAFVVFKTKIDKHLKNDGLASSMRTALIECNYFEHLKRAVKEDDNPESRLENVEEILHSLEIFENKYSTKKPGLAEYLQEISLLANDNPDEEQQKNNTVTLMTLHKSKGLEFPVVFLCNLDDSSMPSPRTVAEGNIDEERRLFYVGMTRAQRKLYLTYPRTKLFRKLSVKVAFTRFMAEIPIDCLDGPIGVAAEEKEKEENANFFAEMRKMFASKSAEDNKPSQNISPAIRTL